METFDALVIGSGLLGCFTARALTAYQMSVALVERKGDVCTGISKANTAIVYSGYDTKPHTLKSKLCVEANASFDKLCADLDIRFCRCGSLMVCFGSQGEQVLRRKYAAGQANSVPGLRLLSGAEVLEMEPQLSHDVYMGLWAPSTGTVDPCELNIAAYENALHNGCKTFFDHCVQAISKENGYYLVVTDKGSFRARAVVNCAGLFADQINELISPPSIRIFPQSADYYILDDKVKGFVKHIIFHEPEEKGKGLTLVPTVSGNLLVGPSEQPCGQKDDYATTKDGLQFLDYWCKKVVPALPLPLIIRNFGSLRPNPYFVEQNERGEYIQLSDRQISGFELRQTSDYPGFFSFIGIKTPGMTCAEGLGRYAATAVANALHISEPNPNFEPRRKAIPRLADLADDKRAELIKHNPSYGKIVCRCRGISEGEIVEAIHRGASTVNGVKRRVGAGSGRCQGGYCLQKVIELIAREKGIPVEAVTLDGAGSQILRGVCHE